MPLARIDIPAGKSPDYRRTVGEIVYEAMLATLNVPHNDRFQVIAEHPNTSLIIDPGYLDIERSRDAIIIQVTLNEGRSVELKKNFYKAVVDALHERCGMRREDVVINLVEVKKENWSFGNGIAQYAP
ncbi:MAG: tautomerase family protein [Sinobacteraceae bacterium]|nr:tautomerase family protein [Nevskiaceae bacterium]MBV9914181.1 tautomerase family protein [Nevskiaceae bacterium]